jgi:hypothetical protein
MQLNSFQGFAPQQSYFPSPVRSPYGGGGPVSSPFGGGGGMQFLFSLMSTIAQLSQGWGAFGGGQPQPQPFGYPQQQPYPQQPFGYPQQQQPYDYASQHFPNLQNYNPGTSTGYGGGGGGGTGGARLPRPSDPRDIASYLQAQVAGGALEGKTGVAQKDAIPGTRFGQVQDSTMWQASLARTYAYQFAAQATGANPLTSQGVQQGMQNFDQMKPEAQLFMQVASVFKGDLLGGPGFYDNPGLANLLQSKGLGNYINGPQVGKTDVQTIGAITAAINDGKLSLNDVINSGTISDLNRYHNVINYVTQGGFANDLGRYDTVPF